MKAIIPLFFVLALSLAAPQRGGGGNSKDATITRYESDNIGIGPYNFAYETSDGTKRTEQGELRNAGTENEALVVRGTISWIGADGTPYTIDFIADENGFQPTGAHLPK